MRARFVWLLLVFFACKGGMTSSGSPAGDGGTADSGTEDASPPVEAGADAPANAPPLDCSQDDADWPMYNHDVCNTRAPTTAGGLSTADGGEARSEVDVRRRGRDLGDPRRRRRAALRRRLGRNDDPHRRVDGQPVWSKAVADLAGLHGRRRLGPRPLVARATPHRDQQRARLRRVAHRLHLGAVARVPGRRRSGHRRARLEDAPRLPSCLGRSPDRPSSRATASTSASPRSRRRFPLLVRATRAAPSAAASPRSTRRPAASSGRRRRSRTRRTSRADGKTPAGYAGAAVWSGTPTVDRKRKRLYVTTGNNYAMPSGVTAAAPRATTSSRSSRSTWPPARSSGRAR